MLLFDVLVMFFYLERDIAHHTEQKRNTLIVACESWHRSMIAGERKELFQKPLVDIDNDRFFFAEQKQSSRRTGDKSYPLSELESAVYETLATAKGVTRRMRSGAGRFFSSQQSVIVTYPIESDGTVIAAAGIQSSLAKVYHAFIRIQKIGLIFVLINSLLFAFIGNRQLSRTYFKPLKRLAKRAETYQDEDPLYFSVRKEDNEFSVLSSSLNKMLHRIADDKRTLTENIASLKMANLELKKAQDDVIRAEKLATVGRLTSGIAHEIGNPIGIVLGYLDLMRQANLSPEERNDFIERSEKEITRINHIIRQLLDMSRFSAGESKPVSIHDLLNDLISVFKFQPSAENIEFEARFSATDDVVFSDPDRLRQVFLNILLNAVDALESGRSGLPKITLITTGPDNTILHDRAIDAQMITVRIQDNGPGIKAADLAQVFDPFFTTKQPGKGTGLGLSVSFMIIEKLGGRLSVSSDIDQGTVFHVVLPISKSD